MALLLTSGTTQAQIIMFEDFEDSVVNYTAPADSITDINSRDYYGRDQLNTGGSDTDDLPTSYSVSNVQGTFFYAMEDMDSAIGGGGAIPNGTPLELDFSINITNYDNLSFAIHIAEDDDGSSEDWDTNDNFKITYQIDGGGFQNLLWVQSSENPGFPGDFVNEKPRLDEDFDGTGEGNEITDTFQQFTRGIAAQVTP